MNVLQKYILLFLCADDKPVTLLQLQIGIKLLSRIPKFKELSDYINKLEEPIYP